MTTEFDAQAQFVARYKDGNLERAVHLAILAGKEPRPECRWQAQPGWSLSADPRKVTCRGCLQAAEHQWKIRWSRPVKDMLPGDQLQLAKALLWEREHQMPTQLQHPA